MVKEIPIRGNYSFTKSFEIFKKIEYFELKAKLAYKMLEGNKYIMA